MLITQIHLFTDLTNWKSNLPPPKLQIVIIHQNWLPDARPQPPVSLTVFAAPPLLCIFNETKNEFPAFTKK